MSRAPKARALGELCEVVGGGTPSRDNPAFWTGTIPWVSPKDMKRWAISDTEEHITVEALSQSATKLVQPPAVLLVVRGMILRRTIPVAITRVPVALNQDMKALLANSDVNPEYLGQMLKALESELLKKVETAGHGTGRLATDVWQAVQIPVPPLTEQARIVERIRELIDRVNEVRRLHEERDASVARLVPATLDDIFSVFRNCDTPLRDVIAFGPQNGLYLPKEQYFKGGTPMVHMGDMFRRFELTGVPERRVQASASLVDKYALRADDVLVARRSLVFEGSGSMTAVGCLPEPTLFESSIIRVRPDTKRLLPGFLVAYFYSREGTRRRLEIARRATISGINQGGLLGLNLPLPTLKLQKSALERIAAIRLLHARLVAEDPASLAGGLPPAILRKALAGEL